MNRLITAIYAGDQKTVASLIDADEQQQQLSARWLIGSVKMFEAVENNFSEGAAKKVTQTCGFGVVPDAAICSDDMWIPEQRNPDRVMPVGPVFRDFMSQPQLHRSKGGIWQVEIYASPSKLSVERLERAVIATNQENFKTITEVIDAAIEPGSRNEQGWIEEKRKPPEQAKELKQSIDKVLGQHYDRSDLQGAVGAFSQAIYKEDVTAMAALFRVKGATDDQYALAVAKSILASLRFQHSFSNNVDSSGDTASDFGFGAAQVYPFLSVWLRYFEHGDVAVQDNDNRGPDIWFRRVDNIWHEEIDTPSGRSIADQATDLEQDSDAVNHLCAEIDAGKYKTVDAARDAMGAAMLNCYADSTFTKEFRTVYKPHAKGHGRPEPEGKRSADPVTPAGAMNRFIRAAERGDSDVVADSLFVSTDKHGAAVAAAMARDYIISVHYVRTVQQKLPEFETNRYWFNGNVIPPISLRDYAEDEWYILPHFPDFAMDSGACWGVPENQDNSLSAKHSWTPIMHHCQDGHWRLGPWYRENFRQLSAKIEKLKAKDELIATIVADLDTGRITSVDQLFAALGDKLERIGVQRITTVTR